MKYKISGYRLFGIIALCFIMPVIAFADNSLSLGKVASNLMDPVTVVMDFVHTACVIIGGAFLFASLIKYIEHRRSPTMVPISTVMFLLIAGLLLIALPLISYITANGFPYSLIRLK